MTDFLTVGAHGRKPRVLDGDVSDRSIIPSYLNTRRQRLSNISNHLDMGFSNYGWSLAKDVADEEVFMFFCPFLKYLIRDRGGQMGVGRWLGVGMRGLDDGIGATVFEEGSEVMMIGESLG